MKRYTITLPESEHDSATMRLPYIHPESGEEAQSFSHLVRLGLRSLPKDPAPTPEA